MPCRVDLCPKCEEYDCGGFTGGECKYEGKKPKSSDTKAFDVSGALCDVLSLLENNAPHTFALVDEATKEWWDQHEGKETAKLKERALAKLTLQERRALGLK